ncbi:MAG: UPF0280 family protein [Methanobrevibacter sp.]|uniref:UPF0280 family protein n=1 Tax=uncultured Methanobrevibacter sp. TaxID=253161 RepID=UPI0025DBE318|nr:UPF0280 family protein [uncultured Methanobrevibacter sp.]MEE1129914.1 UPF0280 family protein [Methanobrevibacter sp.]
MNYQEINLGETHIRLKTDLHKHDLKDYIFSLRSDLKHYIAKNQDFLLSLEPLKLHEESLPPIIKKMNETSNISDVGPMACVAGTISELSLNHLIKNNTKCSTVENGGDIALINDETILCGIYSNNKIIGNEIAFKLKPRKKALGICTSSGKIGHSISFGKSDSVTILSKSASLADGLATRIANDVNGETSQDKISNALETAENYKEYFDGALLISENNIGTIGRLPKIVETNEFNIKI